MNTCPKCGHKFKAENQAKGGKARWRGMTKKARSAAASDAAKARWAKSGNNGNEVVEILEGLPHVKWILARKPKTLRSFQLVGVE